MRIAFLGKPGGASGPKAWIRGTPLPAVQEFTLFRCKISQKDLVEFMTLHLDIPESITSSLRLPAPEMEPRLRAELAVALYGQGILPFGKASELAGVSRYGFADLLGRREIPRHYTEQELAQDLEYAGG